MYSENIYEFSDLNDLKESVKRDLDEFNISSSRFPVRFIFLNSHDELKDIVEILAENATKIELSSFLQSDNSWFTNNELIKKIKDLKESSVIVPLSEFIRFLNDVNFYEILSSLAEIEDTNIKLYIPLVGLWERFNNIFWDRYYRKDNWAPIWKLNSNAKQISIYQITGFDFRDEFETNNLKLVSNTKEWFELWKTDNVTKIISLPKPLSVYFKNSLPDQTFTQEIISSPKDYISKIFDVNINIEYDNNEMEYWEMLLTEISAKNKKNISLKDLFVDNFNINNIENLALTDYLNYYLTNNDTNYQDNHYKYKKWLVKNFFINFREKKDTYLAHCFRKINKLEDIFLTKAIFLEIFNLDYSEKFLEERRTLLKFLKERDIKFPEVKFEENFNNIAEMHFKYQLNYLTNTTDAEKAKIMNILQTNRADFNSIIPKLKIIFPELYYYLDWNFNMENIPNWIFNYFKEYTKSKIFDSKSEALTVILNEHNTPDKFYDWYYDLKDINLDLTSDAYILWIDAFGVEWLPLITYFLNNYLKSSNKKIKCEYIRSVNLPSATEFNKINCDKKLENLDNFIHSTHYGYPNSLIQEIEIIKGIAKEISKINSSKIIIYSDHGFSFLCNKKYGSSKVYDFKDHSHEGRYLLIKNKEMYSNEDYLVHKTESDVHEKQEYLVTLKHLSLGNTPSHEVHGGATPEEVLVPHIFIEDDNQLDINYEVTSKISEINVSKENRLPISIYPEPNNIPIAIYNNEKLNIFKENDTFIVELNTFLNKGKQTIIIKVDGQEEEIIVNIKKGGMEEEEYDFG